MAKKAKKSNFIAVQLETNHDNPDSTAWYAYTLKELDPGEEEEYRAPLSEEDVLEVMNLAKKDGAPLSCDFDEDPVEVPSLLSKATGVYRYWVASAHLGTRA